MRLVTYQSERGARAGILREGEVVDAWDTIGGGGSSLRDLLAAEGIGELAGIVDPVDAQPLAEVELLPPIPDPDKIVCIGLNYRAHAAEAGIEPPEAPTFFAKFRNALAAPGATVPLPAASAKVDYEAEVAFVVGRRCSDVSESEAADFIAGYMLLKIGRAHV